MADEIEVTEVHETEEATLPDVAAEVQRARDESTEKFNQHVKNLVALYAQQILQELEQRILDLELLVGQPAGAVQFVPGEVAYVSDRGNEDDTPWYQPTVG